MSQTSKKGLTRLHELETAEVSLVPQGANRRRFLVFKNKAGTVANVAKDKLTSEHRNNLADSTFALPSERRYPIPDISHARNALARASGKPEEAKVKAAVYRKYPSLKPDVKKDKKGDDDCYGDMVEKIAKADPMMMQKVDDCMKKFQALPVSKDGLPAAPMHMEPDGDEGKGGEGLDEQAKAALKACARILAPFKDKIPPALVHQVADAVGYKVPGPAPGAMSEGNGQQYGGEMDGDEKEEKYAAFQAIPEKIEGVKKEDMDEAVEKAHSAFKEHMEKLGYQKYPDAQMAMKTKDGSTVRKSGEVSVSKSADGATPDLAKVDPETRQMMEGVFKAQKDLIAKNAELQASIETMKAEARKKEIVQKAASFTHLGIPSADIVSQLEMADKVGKEAYDMVCKNFDALNAQGQESKLFGELGSNQGESDDSANAWAKIEKMAEGIVAKSTDGLTKEQAIEKVMLSPEGQRLYKQHQAARRGGI